MNKGYAVKNSLLISSALVAGFLLVGCGGDEKTTPAPTNPSKSSANQAEKPTADNIDKKLSVYIKCFNDARDIDRSVERYQSWVKDMEVGPTGKERSVSGLYELNVNRLTKCKQDIAVVAALPPVTELDKISIVFADNALAVGQAVTPLYKYYDQKDYKDDDFKKGKELHAPLAKAVKEYEPVAEKFSDLIEAENDKRQIVHLAEIEKAQGKNAGYYKLSIVIQAKALANLLYNDKFDLDKAKSLIDQFGETVAAATAYVNNPKNEETMKKQGLMTKSSLSGLVSSADDFTKSAKARYRSIRDNAPIRVTNPVMARHETGTLQNLQAKYNDLVNKYNRY